jgi:DNA-binding transcriptional regulator YbjK
MRRRWNESRAKPRRSVEEILTIRDQRRTEALARCIQDMVQIYGRGGINHALVSQRLGIPLPFLFWKYPTLESLLAVALRADEDQSARVAGGF